MSRDHKQNRPVTGRLATLMVLLFALAASPAFSHCDSESGPIIPLIRQSLDNGNITPVLKWLRAENEAEIKDLFTQVRALRVQSKEAKKVADRLFIETFIRLHRAGEGEPFTGIKKAGDVPPIFAEVDQALKSGKVDSLAGKVANVVREKIATLFKRAEELSKHQDESIEAGREYVEAYVAYVHFVEELDTFLAAGTSEHHPSAEESHGH